MKCKKINEKIIKFLKDLTDDNFVDVIKSQILNNSNLSANLTFKVTDITNIDELNNLIHSTLTR